MPQIKCKMCGGLIQLVDNQSVCECEFCGTTQTVPKIKDNDKLMTLHNRANNLRLRNEFDKALLTYENIISENPKDSEAHWGIVLCRYGIEYVDDPKTGKKIPTCHRTQSTPIFEDYDYKQAIECADVIARNLYQEEAEVINNIQKGILAISVNEEPYDIFICYKENDENGKRTRDSVIAQDIYQELTKNKYRVFFSRISLESKLGSQYEPYIYAALKSSKVMLVIGTKPEYYEAVWVKNEWSRYLSFLKNDEKKYIIPCYKDMDAYELPEELLSFQAQDLNKLGFLQDLLRGIDKIFNRNKKEEITNFEGVDTETLKTINSMLKRVEILIEDEDNKKAMRLLDEILSIDPECTKAYLLYVIVECDCKKLNDLYYTNEDLSSNRKFLRTLRYADPELKAKLEDIQKENSIHTNLNDIYNKLNDFTENHHVYIDELNALYTRFRNLEKSNKYQKLENNCVGSFNYYYKYLAKIDYNSGNYSNALEYLSRCNDDESKKLEQEVKEKLKDKQKIYYENGVKAYNAHNWEFALKYLEKVFDIKKAEEMRDICKKNIVTDKITKLADNCKKALGKSELSFKKKTLEGINSITREERIIINKDEELQKKLIEIDNSKETLENMTNELILSSEDLKQKIHVGLISAGIIFLILVALILVIVYVS